MKLLYTKNDLLELLQQVHNPYSGKNIKIGYDRHYVHDVEILDDGVVVTVGTRDPEDEVSDET